MNIGKTDGKPDMAGRPELGTGKTAQEELKKDSLLSVDNLKVYYPVKTQKGVFAQKSVLKAVDGISFSIRRGETFGLVGESGCGKTTTGKAIVRLLHPAQGEILFEGKNIFSAGGELSKKIQMIFQDPYSSLDPHFTCGRLIGEPLIVSGMKDRRERKEKVLSLMADVGLRPDMYGRYPHEFSGGQRQRIGVARALALNPDLIVCDEPVSALDVSIQAQILNLMRNLQRKYSLTYLFISHNLSVVKHFCDTLAVMYLGQIVEAAPKEELFANVLHPYTKALFDAIPMPDPGKASMTSILEGDIPSPADPPPGCLFASRCPLCTDICRSERPPLSEAASGHRVACHCARPLQQN